MLLRGKVVVVSGVGPGLGRSIAIRSAEHGADVVLAARTRSRLDAVASEVAALGRRALPVQADITDPAAAQRLAEVALSELGRADALVHNAVAMPPISELNDMDLDAVRDAFDANVVAAVRLTRLFTPALEVSGGSVTMISSIVIRNSPRSMGPYKAAKAALLAIAQSLAAESGPRGIRVNTVVPGHFMSEALQQYYTGLARKRGVDPTVLYDETAANTDLGRLPEPDEIADAVVFLSSSMARAITGQCLDVNCGEYHH